MATKATTSVQVAIQQLNATAYKRHKLFLTLDPAFNIGGFSRFFLEGIIRKVSFGINEHVGVAELDFPNRPFGSRVGSFCLPIALYIDNTDNFVFRGFFVDEEGVISTSDDKVSATCLDYKWFISKLSKIRGQIYTVDNNIYPESTPGSPSIFADESMYERFRYVVPGLNKSGVDLNRTTARGIASIDGTGYIGTLPTVFNKNGNPDCSADTPFRNIAFLYDSDIAYFRGIRPQRRSADKYFWNYASIIRYICANYITNVFNGSGNSTKILINETSLATILRYGEKYGMNLIRPINFDITNKSPMEAIDAVVKHIPGSWYWRLLYFPHSVLIDIQNHSDPAFSLPGKSIFIGNYGKLNNKTNNTVNVASAKIKYSIKDVVSHAVAVGGAIDVETTVNYLPAWPQYVRPSSDFDAKNPTDFGAEVSTPWDGVTNISSGSYVSDFKGIKDYNNWRQFISSDARHPDAQTGKLREVVSTEDQLRYARIYRVYIFPENQMYITKFPDVYVDNLLKGYENLATYLDQLFYRYILRPRAVKGPITQYRQIFTYAKFTDNYTDANLKKQVKDKHHNDPPFVFIHDGQLGNTVYEETDAITNSDVITGIYNDILSSKQWILPQEEKNNSFQFENTNKVITFQNPQFERRTISKSKTEREEDIAPFPRIATRDVFVTCRIECDVPLIRDKIANRVAYSNARLVSQEINVDLEACVRVNAFFPNPSFFTGNDVSVNTSSDPNDNNSGAVDEGTTTNSLGSKIVNWNQYEFGSNAPKGVMVVDDSGYLDQILQFMINDAPLYDISGDADLGVIDTSYTVGDKLDRIVNSELSDGSGGYYGLGCVIDKLEYSALAEKTDTYTTKMSYRNKLPIVQYLRNKHKIGRARHGKLD